MAIGVFDSGIGGLTVFKSIAEHFPALDIYYLGDTARVPYGGKSRETIISYSLECAEYLITKCGAEAIVIACNTASSYAVDIISEKFHVPVTGVVLPGAEQALRVSKKGKIGVIGTRATIRSGSYRAALETMSEIELDIYENACPLFVPIVEEMMTESPIAELAVKMYLEELSKKGIDTLVLGCTHYPLLKNTITRLYPQFSIVDSSEVIIEHLIRSGLNTSGKSVRKLFFTDESPAMEILRNELASGAPAEIISLG
ncbi:glutamate racemase [Geovibrio thiophilus]|uniref:Glutamate racemase n=1 Tax=Geovibrio thiophilus TaxID=139438 RepID=A0A3R5YY92_9BACT|nr:glutamate racemase [Geovibrio thiophilus]QAR32392.1 glutamate racemase [Geovibrio thiophilus]